jgi:16S rRNA (cytosine967-C5)-methyltransferase
MSALAEQRPRSRSTDPRRAAYDLITAVELDGAYANLTLPGMLRERGISGRDAGLATELGYGTLRAAGVLDRVIAEAGRRPIDAIDRPARDVLRLGAYQLLRTRIPAHAAVDSSVELARTVGAGRAAGFVNAVLRRVGERDWDAWIARLADPRDPFGTLALRYSHPRWIAAAFAQALGESPDGPLTQTEAALAADDTRPATHLVAWPGRIGAAELAEQAHGTVAGPSDGAAGPGADHAPHSPYAVRMTGGGDPGDLPAVRAGLAAVQDEGSQLAALALADAPIEGADRAWLDLCAGPGGKAALLGALAGPRGARVLANELHPHRAELVRQAIRRAGGGWPVEVRVGDARTVAGRYDRILLDAPCTGLGALRRRPEARWRRQPGDLVELTRLQRDLLGAATRLARPGGIVAYVTCSPHPAETTAIVDEAVSAGGVELVRQTQLWPHVNGTDAMFIALLRRT